MHSVQLAVQKELNLQLALTGSSSKKDTITMELFVRLLKNALPAKSSHALNELKKALELDMKGRRFVDYEGLFKEGEDGARTQFYELMRLQHVNECLSFEKHVMHCINKMKVNDRCLLILLD